MVLWYQAVSWDRKGTLLYSVPKLRVPLADTVTPEIFPDEQSTS